MFALEDMISTRHKSGEASGGGNMLNVKRDTGLMSWIRSGPNSGGSAALTGKHIAAHDARAAQSGFRRPAACFISMQNACAVAITIEGWCAVYEHCAGGAKWLAYSAYRSKEPKIAGRRVRAGRDSRARTFQTSHAIARPGKDSGRSCQHDGVKRTSSPSPGPIVVRHLLRPIPPILLINGPVFLDGMPASRQRPIEHHQSKNRRKIDDRGGEQLSRHLAFMTGFRNRIAAVVNWGWSFIGRTRRQRTITYQQVVARQAIGNNSVQQWMFRNEP